MDTRTLIEIALALASAISVVAWTVAWFWIRSVQRGISENERAIVKKADKADLDAARQHAADFELRTAEEHAAVRLQQSQFEAECAKNFVSNPALVQVMGSLDRTIQQLTQAIQTNAQESRAGIKAINERIDNLMLNRTT